MNRTIQYILISLGIFVFIELQVILYVSIDNYIKIHNITNTEIVNKDMRPNMNDSFNPFSRNNDDDNSNDSNKSNSKRNTTNEKPSV